MSSVSVAYGQPRSRFDVQSARTGQRGNPQAPTVSTVVRAKLRRDVYKTLSKVQKADTLPLGNVDDHRIRQGEPVFKDCTDSAVTAAQSVVHENINLHVFAGANGRSRSTKYQFIGIALHEASPGDEDTGIAIQTSGVNTIINTGDEAVGAGQAVMARLPSKLENPFLEGDGDEMDRTRRHWITQVLHRCSLSKICDDLANGGKVDNIVSRYSTVGNKYYLAKPNAYYDKSDPVLGLVALAYSNKDASKALAGINAIGDGLNYLWDTCKTLQDARDMSEAMDKQPFLVTSLLERELWERQQDLRLGRAIENSLPQAPLHIDFGS